MSLDDSCRFFMYITTVNFFSFGWLSSSLSLRWLLVYLYVFTILQWQYDALLFGSIGPFISPAAIMHFLINYSGNDTK